MNKTEIKPSTPFPNGMSYEYFLEVFCGRCKKHKTNKKGFCAFVEEGGCPIENAIEDARLGHPFPSQEIVRVYKNGEILSWNVCTKFESDDETLMKKYKAMMGETE